MFPRALNIRTHTLDILTTCHWTSLEIGAEIGGKETRIYLKVAHVHVFFAKNKKTRTYLLPIDIHVHVIADVH